MTKMVEVLVNGRWPIKLPEHRAARPEWTSPEGWERKRLNSIYNWVTAFNINYNTKPIVYYVGAEEGDMCALIQMWGAEIVMFEPNPAVWPNVRAIWNANNLQAPLMSFPGFAANHTTEGALGEAYANAMPICADGEVISNHGFKNLCEADGTIPAIKIDALDGLFMEPVHMISIDVEGAEWEVLRGAEETLRKYHPRIYLSLHPEFLYEIYKEYAGDLRHWIKQLGYKETLLDYQHECHFVYEAEK